MLSPCSLLLLTAGSNSAANTPTIAITTNSSIRVKPVSEWILRKMCIRSEDPDWSHLNLFRHAIGVIF
jgi:hypothetical protein